MTIETVILDYMKMGISERVSGAIRPEFTVDSDFYDSMIYRFSTYLLAENLPSAEQSVTEPVNFLFPSSPFQFWKKKHSESWWLRWYVNKWPTIHEQHVKQVKLTVNIKRHYVYPESKIRQSDDRFGRSIRAAFIDKNTEVWG